ncbi:hypothetical protein [Burkholderia sp. Ac-20353]|uniref:hypothetical protein n=1 Tax=Burkholderia sp. Ac-20353 TaxID=2703894 RepID=UPI00197BD75E|nr:hypothetical protein [Burkholderia sp. Ac-20353]MBN3789507.1 hypothetical protein [Burkholderia sp. Ac-20353]
MVTLADALRLAINAVRDVAESRKIPSGVDLETTTPLSDMQRIARVSAIQAFTKMKSVARMASPCTESWLTGLFAIRGLVHPDCIEMPTW